VTAGDIIWVPRGWRAWRSPGFANFGSLGIMVGGIAAMAPQRRAEIASLGARTMVSGTLATLMTAAVVGAMTAG
jgi:CNT family concentrative nucleoside transporter